MIKLSRPSVTLLGVLNGFVIVASVILCLMLSLARLPGMELLGITPNWLLIWTIAWSIKRTVFEGAIAGLALGLISDGMVSTNPSHVFSFVLVGVLTAKIHKRQYFQQDFITVVLTVFGMAILAETVMAIQLSFQSIRNLKDIWIDYQRIALSSAILSSLWSPVLYYPLSGWWERVKGES